MEGSTFSFIKARVWFKVRIRSLGFGKGQASFKAAVAKFDKAAKQKQSTLAPLALQWCPVTADEVTAAGSDHLWVLPVCVQVPEQRRLSRVWALTDLQTHWLEWLSSACRPTCLQCTDRNVVNAGDFKLHSPEYLQSGNTEEAPSATKLSPDSFAKKYRCAPSSCPGEGQLSWSVRSWSFGDVSDSRIVTVRYKLELSVHITSEFEANFAYFLVTSHLQSTDFEFGHN